MLSQLKYKLDWTGKLPENRVESKVTIGATTNRAFALPMGPFYCDDVTIIDVNNPQTPLDRGRDVEFVMAYTQLSKKAEGKEICGVVVVKNPSVGTDLIVHANHVGGPYVNQYNAIIKAIEDLQLDNREVDFSRLEGVPENWEAAPHLQDLGDIYGFEFINSILAEMISVASAGKTPEVQVMIDGLTAIEKRLQDAVTAHREAEGNVHNTTANQTGTYNTTEIDQLFNTIRNEISVVASSLGDVNDKLGMLDDKLTAVEKLFEANTKIIASLSQDFTTLTVNYGDVNKAIADQKNRDKGQDQKLATIATELQRIEQKATELDGKVGEGADDLLTKDGGVVKGTMTAAALGVSNPNPAQARGVNLMGEANPDGPPDYGIYAGQTGTYGGHGFVTGDLATYFQMQGARNRGWIFRFGSQNVASISGDGDLRLNGRIFSDEDVRGYSDERLKDNIVRIPNALEKVLSIGGYTFYRDGGTGERETGVIAQEMLKVLPEVVQLDDEDEHYTVAYGQINALLIEAIKEQTQQVNSLAEHLGIPLEEVDALAAKILEEGGE